MKAKLVELGSGAAGYIDDELPDYVMIMVANKRSKDQMIGDLSLFLGKNTDTFVNWLHQVLDKLQEVTLPSNGMNFNLIVFPYFSVINIKYFILFPNSSKVKAENQ